MNDFQWIGKSTPSKRGFSYKSFTCGDVIYNIGDYVLIRNDNSVDPEDIFNCFIAQIKDLYETDSVHKPYQAHVRWFSRTSDLPIHCQKSLDQIYDFEVVEDNRKGWSNVIDAETIFDKCEIAFLKLYEEPPNDSRNGEAVFFCRYGFVGYKLKPLEDSRFICKSLNKDIKPSRKKDLYIATTTGSPMYPRVLIRRIDDKILACKNENIRILVAKSDAKSIEDVTANLDELTLLSPSKTMKRPYIHSLTVSSQNNESDHSDMDCLTSDAESQHDTNLNRKWKNNSSKELFENKTPVRTSIRIKNCTPKRVENAKNGTPKRVENAKNGTPKRVDNAKNGTPKRVNNAKTGTPKKVDSSNNGTSNRMDNDKKILKSGSKRSTSPRKSIAMESSPSKKAKTPRRLEFSVADEYTITRSGRKVKSVPRCVINDSDDESKTVMADAKKKISKFIRTTYSDDSESAYSVSSEESSSENEDIEFECEEEKTPKTREKRSRSKSIKNSLLRKKSLSAMPDRKTPLKGPQNLLEESRLRLHVSAVPKSLPCRVDEYSDIYSFVKGCLCSHTGGCMYISGVPGTGKTATVHEVIRNLENEKEEGEVPIFNFVEVNGMWVTDPYQCYVNIFKALTGKTIASQQAANLLEKRFTEQGPKKDAVILLVDELDRLWTRKQTVLYNIFDWPSKKHSKLIVLAIANTMDLPERLMMNRISSRLGLTRKIFQPYNFKQLQEIIMSRIQELNVFDKDAVQLVSRKVAAVSGDARRALDICRHATEVAERSKSSPKKKSKILVGMDHVDIAIQQMFSSPVISAIRCASKLEKLFFQCILADFSRTGSEETTLLKVLDLLDSSCRFEGILPPSTSEVTHVCARLVHSNLILVDNFRNGLYMKIRLNASPDDVNTALVGKNM
nr:origin recognition complex subunit 1 isoform X2 [Parasteatoda tepidariorum]